MWRHLVGGSPGEEIRGVGGDALYASPGKIGLIGVSGEGKRIEGR